MLYRCINEALSFPLAPAETNYSLMTQMLELKTAQCRLWHEGLLHPL